MSTNCPVISTQKNLKENQLHGSHDFPVDIHMDYFPVSENGEHTLYVPMHWHPEVEFHYQLQGSVRIQVELTEYVLHPGEVLWINAKQLHDCHPVGNETAVSHTSVRKLRGSRSGKRSAGKTVPYLRLPEFPQHRSFLTV